MVARSLSKIVVCLDYDIFALAEIFVQWDNPADQIMQKLIANLTHLVLTLVTFPSPISKNGFENVSANKADKIKLFNRLRNILSKV